MKKLTIDDLHARVCGEEYIRIAGTTTTICAMTTVSGFVVVGKSACLVDRDFDEKIGRSIARDDAINQLWQLEGYRVNNEHYARTRKG